MKKQLLLMMSAGLSLFALGQEADAVNVGASAANDVWYSLSDGVEETRVRNEWDVAIGVAVGGARGFSIRVNDVDATLYAMPDSITPAKFELVTTQYVTDNIWTALYNSDTTWETGGFNQLAGINGMFDYSFANYNMAVNNGAPDGPHAAHSLVATRVFVLKYSDDTYKKLYISLSNKGTDGYLAMITSAGLDDNEDDYQRVEHLKSDYAEKNFFYYSVKNNEVLDREPASADWDLLFGRYIANLGVAMYPVNGVLVNHGVKVQKVSNVDPETFTEYDEADFTDNIKTIGHDWKTYNMEAGAYEIASNTVYFIKDKKGDVWKLYFTGFNSANGVEMAFVKEKMDGGPTTGLFSNTKSTTMNLYPNPVQSGSGLFIDSKNAVEQVQISDLHGVVLYEAASTSLSLPELQSGTYLVQVKTTQGLEVQKLIVE